MFRTALQTFDWPRRGGAALATVLAILVLLGVVGTVITMGPRSMRARGTSEGSLKAQAVAEAGINDGLSRVLAGHFAGLGSESNPIECEGGSYWVTVEKFDVANRSYRLTARATYASDARTIEAVVRPTVDLAYQTAVFAGNSSMDPRYTLELGGRGSDADVVEGDVYSGNDVAVTGDARVRGAIRARGRVNGSANGRLKSQSVASFAGRHYGTGADCDVEHLFAAATCEESPAGGRAWQLPRESPAHMFRKNPSDREAETRATEGDDYFLEDPYEAVRLDANGDGADACRLTFAGAGANHRVFRIHGDLWILNTRTNSFRFQSPENDPTSITIVVQGDIHIADNLYYADPQRDGVALIALCDAGRKSSGNILLGDPSDSTLTEVDAFLYAENDVRSVAVDARAPRRTTVRGSLSAGNHVDLGCSEPERHVALALHFDERLVAGRLTLPWVSSQVRRATAFSVLSWRESARP
ncbi:MAG TPA: hypothetical protein VGR31_06410 [Planctomycetota bacterium]|jgi:hypothetical protein|nr:hypothetical protein [Planctomycetota bacterium]